MIKSTTLREIHFRSKGFLLFLVPLWTMALLCLPIGACLGVEILNELQVNQLTCEYKHNPIGIGELKPRLSWQLQSNEYVVLQTAYQIRAGNEIHKLVQGQGLLWDTGKVESEQSVNVPYRGPPAISRQRLYWQVRVWDNHGNQSAWSEPAFWEMGLLKSSDWQAKWVEPNLRENPNISNPCPLLRKVFTLKGGVTKGRLYVTSHGLYEVHINGQRVGNQVFTPGWTVYDKRLQYQVFDLSNLLHVGDNCIAVILGDGWYRGRLHGTKKRNQYGERLALLSQIEVYYTDGNLETIGTDGSWRANTGPILVSDIYDGEIYDARLELPGWDRPGFAERGWTKVKLTEYDNSRLVATIGPPVRRIEEIKPVKLLHTPEGQTIVDLGQNMVGWVRIRVHGPTGTKVTLRHAEVLNKEGNIYSDNLRLAKQTDTYILKGEGIEIFEPHFTFHGFRFVLIEGWPSSMTLDNIIGIVVHSDIQPTGKFQCSNELINQLQHNIWWSQKGNFLDVPTDCPQRDERLGWTGDAQVFARTACFNANCATFYSKWLADLAADQRESGAVPDVVPDVRYRGRPHGGASAGWADAAVIIPWTVYQCYGDKRILQRQFPSMKAWVQYMRSRAGDSFFWNQDTTFGDWLSDPDAITDKDLISQAYFAHSSDLLSRAAMALGRTADAQEYRKLFNQARKAFQNEFVTPNGRLASNTQTAYTLALAFNLLPENLRAMAASRLAANVNSVGHITTGFLGSSLICHVLSDFGYFKEAFALLERTAHPSWLYPVTRGATTIWERWDGIRPDGSFQDKGMNSFNHYAYGAIGDWLYRVIAGIEIAESKPGYKHIVFKPHPGGDLTYARATLQTMYGLVEAGWHLQNGEVSVVVQIPANATASLYLAGARLSDIKENYPKTLDQGVLSARQEGKAVCLELGSGRYEFHYYSTTPY